MSLPMGIGQPDARVMLIGECYGGGEADAPFTGTAGQELNRMLSEAGILRSECYLTNLVNARPKHGDIEHWVPKKKTGIKPTFIPLHGKLVDPIVLEGLEQVKKEIDLVNPHVIITFGNLPLWALTGIEGAMKWRGSLLDYEGTRLIPTLHPAMIIKQWEYRSPMVNDLRRAYRELTAPVQEPKWNFQIRPTYSQVMGVIADRLADMEARITWLDLDIETSKGHIACVGFSWSRTDAMVIPLMTKADRYGYWSEEEEASIVYALYKLLTHPNCRVRWQNGLFDAQYIHRSWHFIPRHGQDTMISWHVMFAGQKKSLDYQASILCDHYVQWKPEKSEWKNGD